MKERVKETLQSNVLFQVLPESVLDEMIEASQIKFIPRNHFVIHKKETENDLFLLLEGLAKSTVMTEEGEEFTVRFYHPGDLAGIINALAEEGSAFSVQTVDDAYFAVIDKRFFNKLVHDYPLFSEHLTHDISNRLQQMYHSLALESSSHSHGFETYPYRKKVGELMDSPVLSVPPGTGIIPAAQLMMEKQISSLLVMEDGQAEGIVTERDLMKLIPTYNKIPLLSVSDIMSRQVITIREDAYLYEAMLTMMKHNIKHLPVLANGKMNGMVTLRKLTDFRGNLVLEMVKEIDDADSIERLALQHKSIASFIERMLNEGATPHEICSLTTEFNDRILRRIIELSEQSMVKNGYGAPLPTTAGLRWEAKAVKSRR